MPLSRLPLISVSDSGVIFTFGFTAVLSAHMPFLRSYFSCTHYTHASIRFSFPHTQTALCKVITPQLLVPSPSGYSFTQLFYLDSAKKSIPYFYPSPDISASARIRSTSARSSCIGCRWLRAQSFASSPQIRHFLPGFPRSFLEMLPFSVITSISNSLPSLLSSSMLQVIFFMSSAALPCTTRYPSGPVTSSRIS